MGRTLVIYSDGTRNVTGGGVFVRPWGLSVIRMVDLSQISDEDYEIIKERPTDDVFITDALAKVGITY